MAMLVGVFILALAASCAPIAAVLLVSLASRREEADWSLSGAPAGGPVRAAARRVLNFGSDELEWPVPRGRIGLVTAYRDDSQSAAVLEFTPPALECLGPDDLPRVTASAS
jgi:hypothetical protein